MPGWNWISYTNAVSMDIGEALGDFTPEQGDIIKSRTNTATYNGTTWRGSFTQFMPGQGYHYYSNRTEVVSFVFSAPSPQLTVTTTDPADITATSAVVGGTVTLPEGSHVFLRGVCWGTEPSPDIDGDHTSEETATISFSSTLDSLTPNTTYYVRAYVVSDSGLSYGNEVSFTTLEGSSGNVPEGAINGLFTINANGDQVYFSQGNLQYIGSAATPYWKFADNQWDYLGTTTGQNSSDPNVDRDLFGWGTSGYNHGAVCYQPWSTSTTNNQYYAYGNWQNNLYNQTGQADWGFNAINNGGNTENSGWRTLTTDEWCCILTTRNASTVNGVANARFAKAIVANIYGLILFPDNYEHPSEVAQPIGINDTSTGWNGADYTAMDFALMEAHGAVFLPSAGDRASISYIDNDHCGSYWSSSHHISISYAAYFIRFSSYNLSGNTVSIGHTTGPYHGYSVRLVRNID